MHSIGGESGDHDGVRTAVGGLARGYVGTRVGPDEQKGHRVLSRRLRRRRGGRSRLFVDAGEDAGQAVDVAGISVGDEAHAATDENGQDQRQDAETEEYSGAAATGFRRRALLVLTAERFVPESPWRRVGR
jgi:hypothetical protein